ncbi:MAG TPA: CHAT domain-containing protein [Longimicrobium sp.]|jgi:CHAT domain-containing protein/tetratricopeptide (TPR) repeat protein
MGVNRSRLLLLGAGLALAAATASATLRGISRPSVLDDLVDARPGRVFSPRLSIPLVYRPCTVQRSIASETVPREACGAENVFPADLDAVADPSESSDPDTLQVSALLALIGPSETERSLDSAISRLSRALRLSSRAVPLLVDLSGMYLVRAQLTQNPLDLLQGLGYALEALGSEPGNSAAWFNTALALESIGLDERGTLAWTAYLRVDSTSEWAAEARRRRQRLQHPPRPRAPEPESSQEAVRAFAMNHPQEARLLGWDTVLGRWGAAVEAGNTAEAARQLQLADRLGATLAWRGGDASLADAVGAIRAAADDPAATLALARAHRRYAAAQTLYLEHDTRASAADTLARLVAALPHSPTLAQSAKAFQAATLVYDGGFAEADSAYQALLTRIDSVRHPALAARVRWMRGTGLIRADHYVEARASYRSAARLFERAGETEFAAYAHAQDGEAAYYQRDTVAAYRAMHRGLTTLRGVRSSRWLHNTLFVLANAATADGMPLAAEQIRDENVSVARRLPSSSVKVEALLGLADIRALTARPRQAAEDLNSAAAIVARMADSKPRRDFEAVLGSLAVLVERDSASIVGLDSAVEYFKREKNSIWLIPALLRRADVRLAHGDLPAAAADLNDATAWIRDLSHNQRSAYLRVAMMERARIRFDQLVMLHVRARMPVAALQTLEHGRVSFAPRSAARAAVPPAAPPGQVAVEYALIGDTLLTWTVVGDDVRLRLDTLDRGDLVLRIERVMAALESPSRAPSARPDLERLYDLLVRPVKDRLGAPGTSLVVLADGEAAGVPFPALVDSGSGRYLIEDHPLRFPASLADAARPASAAAGSARPALLVANPAFDPLQYPRLDPLEGAQAEVDSLAALYPGSVRLSGVHATRGAFMANATRAGIIHYAGHAVFDDARPERSALVLAGADTTGRLTAEAVNGLQLRGVRLVVLAACRTSRSREGRSGGFSGFSGALLGAGAGGVVGSLWEVDDSLTQPFMLAFHRAYRRTSDPATALRDAQLEMLHSRNPALSSPAVWGGFRYIGR